MYVVRAVRCRGCPLYPYPTVPDPRRRAAGRGPRGHVHPRRHRAQDARAARSGARSARAGTWPELDRIDPAAGGSSRAEVDALRLMAVFLNHWDTKGHQPAAGLPGGGGQGRRLRAPVRAPPRRGRDLRTTRRGPRRLEEQADLVDPATCRVEHEGPALRRDVVRRAADHGGGTALPGRPPAAALPRPDRGPLPGRALPRVRTASRSAGRTSRTGPPPSRIACGRSSTVRPAPLPRARSDTAGCGLGFGDRRGRRIRSRDRGRQRRRIGMGCGDGTCGSGAGLGTVTGGGSGRGSGGGYGGVNPANYFFRLDEARDPDERFDGTLPPARRASLSPMAMACLRLFTFLPERPDLSFAALHLVHGPLDLLTGLGSVLLLRLLLLRHGRVPFSPTRSPADRPARIERRERIHDDQRRGQPEEHLGDGGGLPGFAAHQARLSTEGMTAVDIRRTPANRRSDARHLTPPATGGVNSHDLPRGAAQLRAEAPRPRT